MPFMILAAAFAAAWWFDTMDLLWAIVKPALIVGAVGGIVASLLPGIDM